MTPDTIILHHSLTKDNHTVSWQAIRHYHTSYKVEGVPVTAESVPDLYRQGLPVEKPWADIGYHFGIEEINGRIEILVGRMPDMPGAHCSQDRMNHRSLGICFVGCFDVEPPPPAQWQAGVKLVRSLCNLLSIPNERIFGHHDFAPYKTCPGYMFDMKKFRKEVCNG